METIETIKEIALASILYPLAIFGLFYVANHFMGYNYNQDIVLPIAFSLAGGHSIRGVWQKYSDNKAKNLKQ